MWNRVTEYRSTIFRGPNCLGGLHVAEAIWPCTVHLIVETNLEYITGSDVYSYNLKYSGIKDELTQTYAAGLY